MFLYYIKTIKKIFLLAKKIFTKSKNPFISEWILKKNNTI